LPVIYRAADVFVLPSVQDNLPNTVVEALACGKPVVGFRSSGLATMIADGRTGWLAQPFSASSLAVAVQHAMAATYGEEWSVACRNEFDRLYAWPRPAEKYLNLYAEMRTDARREQR
jgi:glycosyltransferase involved in cell wall biosynthesis